MLSCDWCGKAIEKYQCQVTKHNFCSRACLGCFSSRSLNPTGYSKLKDLSAVSERMSEMNRKLNPFRMAPDIRQKLRKSQLRGGQRNSYPKFFGRHEHRVVAENMMGRKLKSREIVHHIDGDRRNNRPSNLMVFPSQKEHAEWHAKFEFIMRGGDAK